MAKPLLLEVSTPEDTPPNAHIRLLTALLERALLDLRGRGNAGYASVNWAREAYAWLMDDTIAPFSFTWICLELDYDIETVRKVGLDIYKANRPVNRFNINRRGHTVPALTFSPIKEDRKKGPQTPEDLAALMNRNKKPAIT
jgi:hypothetical protein